MLNWQQVLDSANQGNPKPEREVTRSDEEWRTLLDEQQYYVMRQHGTERAFSNAMCELFEPGLYQCAGCQTLLFDSATKFDSGTGWPSFSQPVKFNAISYHMDQSLARARVEVRCNTCESHLGHVFPDGPPPSGLRYCINSVAVNKLSA
ncbi:TPA: peptide-methionine (R)-S-oxide reductase MsrB [Vibrio cholerae]|nr:peptide-methionine (R)-S-oxide reductase MsrB [Vibrio cholerae]